MVTMVTMVTENIISFFYFDPDRAWLAGHFDVLHYLLYAHIDPWDAKHTKKYAKLSKLKKTVILHFFQNFIFF